MVDKVEDAQVVEKAELALEKPNQATDLIQAALDKQVPVEILERLLGLHERIEDRSAVKGLSEALTGFQAECPRIPRSHSTGNVSDQGSRFAFKYAPLDVIAETIQPILKKFGLSYSWDANFEEGMQVVTCTVTHKDGAKKTATFAAPIDKAGRMNVIQSHAAAMTYAQRYSLSQALGITTTDDIDGNDPPKSTELISEDQVHVILGLLHELAPADKIDAYMTRFLKLAKVNSIDKISVHDFDRLAEMLGGKVDEMRKKRK